MALLKAVGHISAVWSTEPLHPQPPVAKLCLESIQNRSGGTQVFLTSQIRYACMPSSTSSHAVACLPPARCALSIADCKILIVEILPPQTSVPFRRLADIQKEVSEMRRIRPTSSSVLVRPPSFCMLHGFLGKMGQRSISSAFENREASDHPRTGVSRSARKPACRSSTWGTGCSRRKTRDRLRIQAVQAQHLVAGLPISRIAYVRASADTH